MTIYLQRANVQMELNEPMKVSVEEFARTVELVIQIVVNVKRKQENHNTVAPRASIRIRNSNPGTGIQAGSDVSARKDSF